MSERHINWFLPVRIWTSDQTCALTRNQTPNLSITGICSNQLRRTCQAHWLILVCVLAGGSTNNLGVSGLDSNELSHPAKALLSSFHCCLLSLSALCSVLVRLSLSLSLSPLPWCLCISRFRPLDGFSWLAGPGYCLGHTHTCNPSLGISGRLCFTVSIFCSVLPGCFEHALLPASGSVCFSLFSYFFCLSLLKNFILCSGWCGSVD